jgi:hypothetical protein
LVRWRARRVAGQVGALILVGASGAAAALAIGQSPSAPPGSATCPKGVVAAHATLDDAIVAARRLLINGQTVTSQGETVRLTPRNTPLLAVARVFPAGHRPAVPGAEALRRLAERRCGAATARQSWAVVINYTYGSVASNNVWTWYLVQTRSGWKRY